MYEPRLYRIQKNKKLKYFSVGFKETDLLIGISPQCYSPDLVNFILERVIYLRRKIEAHIICNPDFLSSLEPIDSISQNKDILKMLISSKKANVGPMASVAGLFSENIGYAILEKYAPENLIVENGGDIFIRNNTSLDVSIFAKTSKIKENIVLEISEKNTLGICTSSAKFGHSLSFGKADSVTVISENTCLADAFATAYCNRIRNHQSVDTVLNHAKSVKEIKAIYIIFENRLYGQGKFRLKCIRNQLLTRDAN